MSNLLLANSFLLITSTRTNIYTDKEPGPRTPTLTTTITAVDYVNADPEDYLNKTPSPRWIT